jgi:hypothetical protein
VPPRRRRRHHRAEPHRRVLAPRQQAAEHLELRARRYPRECPPGDAARRREGGRGGRLRHHDQGTNVANGKPPQRGNEEL